MLALLLVLGLNKIKVKRCDGSDVKAEDSGLKGLGFNPLQRQEKLRNNLSCFGLIASEPMRSTS